MNGAPTLREVRAWRRALRARLRREVLAELRRLGVAGRDKEPSQFVVEQFVFAQSMVVELEAEAAKAATRSAARRYRRIARRFERHVFAWADVLGLTPGAQHRRRRAAHSPDPPDLPAA